MTATGVDVSSAMICGIVKATVKAKKYEKLQNLAQKPEESTEIRWITKRIIKSTIENTNFSWKFNSKEISI